MANAALSLQQIASQYRQLVTEQSYAPTPAIDGVRLLDLKWMTDDGGAFVELGRLDDAGRLLNLPDFQVRQVNFSELQPGAVKAWHLHFHQEDLWFVPPTERLLVGLRDLRADSPTCGGTMRFTMGVGKSQLLLIPRGVAHGAANPWSSRTLMLYFVTQHFRTEPTDERRLPWDAFGKEFWEIQKG